MAKFEEKAWHPAGRVIIFPGAYLNYSNTPLPHY